jgi:hypothetical protein
MLRPPEIELRVMLRSVVFSENRKPHDHFPEFTADPAVERLGTGRRSAASATHFFNGQFGVSNWPVCRPAPTIRQN